jgi:hypothetical protein
MPFSWIGVGVVKPSVVSVATIFLERPRSSKVVKVIPFGAPNARTPERVLREPVGIGVKNPA